MTGVRPRWVVRPATAAALRARQNPSDAAALFSERGVWAEYLALVRSTAGSVPGTGSVQEFSPSFFSDHGFQGFLLVVELTEASDQVSPVRLLSRERRSEQRVEATT